MSETHILHIHAFTKDGKGGNPAGVILDAQHLNPAERQHIAAELSYSESAFLNGDRIEFFSPTQRVSRCMHATIATVHGLLGAGRISTAQPERKLSLHTGDVSLPIEWSPDGFIAIQQNAPEFAAVHDERRQEIAKLLSLLPNCLSDLPLQTVSCGVPKLMIPLRSFDDLLRIEPDLPGIAEYSATYQSGGFYPFTFDTLHTHSDLHARQFNPAAGIDEDPITGVAAGAVASYLRQYGKPKDRYVIEQGYSLGFPGEIIVEMRGGEPKVGGYAKLLKEEWKHS